eukprot:COSAG05_NODE_5972_length_1048_cov_1.462592_1_plen_72_part_00
MSTMSIEYDEILSQLDSNRVHGMTLVQVIGSSYRYREPRGRGGSRRRRVLGMAMACRLTASLIVRGAFAAR